MTLRTRGETVEEYAAAAAVMRAKCRKVRAPEGAIDIVGTGGRRQGHAQHLDCHRLRRGGRGRARGQARQPQPQLEVRALPMRSLRWAST
jgi:hypothetical protein